MGQDGLCVRDSGLLGEIGKKPGLSLPSLAALVQDYFHNAEVPAVASACRSLLRQLGATVSQRRSGTEQVPAHLRQLGITSREYEVCQLLVDRIGNKSIAYVSFDTGKTWSIAVEHRDSTIGADAAVAYTPDGSGSGRVRTRSGIPSGVERGLPSLLLPLQRDTSAGGRNVAARFRGQ